MTEDHKNKIAEILMNDYDIRPSLARFIVKVLIDSAEELIRIDKRMKE